jgi:sorting and assembly machinery component 37
VSDVPTKSTIQIATANRTVHRTGELPALQNGSIWVSRFRNIVDYLRQYSDGAWNLDENLGEVEQADSVAYVSHILHAMFIFN